MPLDRDELQLLLLAAGLIPLAWKVGKDLLRGLESIGYKKWPLIPAQIERVRTDVNQIQGQRVETHAVEYTYVVENCRFHGEFPALEPWSSHYTTVTPWDVMYPTGKTIQVYCNPKDPALSVAVVPDPEGMPKAV